MSRLGAQTQYYLRSSKSCLSVSQVPAVLYKGELLTDSDGIIADLAKRGVIK